ncbi:MAG: DUF5106 domain-containing protein [Algoriphagus sp.]|uniref:DUF5106 domain-containing protein n=1 Tax=Algoriphagus sp. TaxID=1872435 RepID=UPI00261970D3|nr:redoxin domain-containing protein [Algoriphagus sp.]MDG1278443.1 DUF5106 domain-containing protein [Algoriphagus sp.]
MFRSLLAFLFLTVISFSIQAQSGYDIEVSISDYDEPEIYLAYYYGDKTYIKDTTYRTEEGTYIFSGEESLPVGVYMVALPPNNSFFELLIDEEQQFSVSSQYSDLIGTLEIHGDAPDNKQFYEYMQFLNEKRVESSSLQAIVEDESTPKTSLGKSAARIELTKLNEEVEAYQQDLLNSNPKSFTSTIIKSGLPLNEPDFEGENAETLRWRWYQKHFFDNIDLGDPRLLRSPVLFNRVDYFINKLQIQHPDTISKAIDWVLTQMEPAPETYKYYTVHFVNTYAQSKMMGMDAVYVHLINKYYATGKADWAEQEMLEKMLTSAAKIEPLLIGNEAPNAIWRKQDGSILRLHDVESPLTLLLFWRYDCSSCIAETAALQEVYESYKNKGLSIIAVCTKTGDEVSACWEYANQKGYTDWIHVADANNEFGGMDSYDVRSTPLVYLLNDQKEIVAKKISVDQLSQVLDQMTGN